MTKSIDPNITIRHENMRAHFASDGKPVSDLYLWNHYRAALLEIERLENELEAAKVDRLEMVVRRGLAAQFGGNGKDDADFDEREQALFLQGTGRK